MVQKKIALLGASGVGKTSLVRRFVESLFDEKYLTTIGVKVDKKTVRARGQDVSLMIWDIAGAEERFAIPSSYVRGVAGYVLVADGTRRETVGAAHDILQQMDRDVGALPLVLAINKKDLVDRWGVAPADLGAFGQRPHAVVETSAKTGDGVEQAFQHLADAIL
jgi:small GTP-binding protein